MKTNLSHLAAHTLNVTITETYNKVERIKRFNRTNYTAMKQFDFTQSVDSKYAMPQF